MHLEGYEVFRAIVELGSVNKAAKALHMTQSTASRHLQALENELGGLFFERSANGLVINELGKVLYPHVVELLNCHIRAKEEIVALRRQGGGIAVGATFSIGEYILPELLGQYKKNNPSAQILMRISNTVQVVQDLMRQRIDLGLVEGIVNEPEIHATPWREDELVLVCAPDHELIRKAPITLLDLRGVPLLWREEGSGTRQVTEQALEKENVLGELTVAMVLGSTQAIKSAIESGLGIAFLSRLTIAKEYKDRSLAILQIQKFHITRMLYIIERNGSKNSLHAEQFLHFLQHL